MKITYKFLIIAGKDKTGKASISLQLTADRKSTKRAIGFSCLPKDWIEKTEQTRFNHATNSKINELKQRITDLQYELGKKSKKISVVEFANLVFNVTNLKTYLTTYFEDHMNKSFDAKILSEGTYKHHKTCLKYLKEFVFEKYKTQDIEIKDVDYSFIVDYNSFLQKKGLHQNTIISSHHKKFKSVLLDAIKHQILSYNPYSNYTLKVKDTYKTPLNKSELKQLIKADLGGNNSLEIVRDLFVFSCYTGLRYSDMKNLQIQDIKFDGSNYFILREQTKTGETINIPIYEVAIDILKKYDNDERAITGKVFPVKSNQKINSDLKIIANLAGLKLKITSHIARYTCMTVLLNEGLSEINISKLLGHKNTRLVSTYAKLYGPTLQKEVFKAFDNINIKSNGKL